MRRQCTKTAGTSKWNHQEVNTIAIVAKQEGVLAADESNPTIKKRFDSIKVESTEENRRRYRLNGLARDGKYARAMETTG